MRRHMPPPRYILGLFIIIIIKCCLCDTYDDSSNTYTLIPQKGFGFLPGLVFKALYDENWFGVPNNPRIKLINKIDKVNLALVSEWNTLFVLNHTSITTTEHA